MTNQCLVARGPVADLGINKKKASRLPKHCT